MVLTLPDEQIYDDRSAVGCLELSPADRLRERVIKRAHER
jgi:hypothetical protein